MPGTLTNPGQGARRMVLRALCLFVFLLPAYGQTLRPILLEHGQKAHGKFELVNDTLLPLNVVLEAKSFTVDEQGGHPLPSAGQGHPPQAGAHELPHPAAAELLGLL